MEDEKKDPDCPECAAEKKEGYCDWHKTKDAEYYFNALSRVPSFFWGIAFFIIFIILGSPFFALALNGLTNLFNEEDLKSLAAYGDSFGGLNALFSGLAFAGLIWTIILQRNELSLQRLELSETRKELKKSAEAQEDLTKIEAIGRIIENLRHSIFENEEKLAKLKKQKESIKRIHLPSHPGITKEEADESYHSRIRYNNEQQLKYAHAITISSSDLDYYEGVIHSILFKMNVTPPSNVMNNNKKSAPQE